MAILVVGLGTSGYYASLLCIERFSDDLCVYDDNMFSVDPSKVEDIRSRSLNKGVLVRFLTKGDDIPFDDVKLAVVSPGISPRHWLICELLSRGIPVTGEVEFAYGFVKDKTKVVGVTGTNGKTTTTSLIYHGLSKHSGLKVLYGGNIGIPFSKIVLDGMDFDVVVLELSSFQLMYSSNLKIDVGVFLNVDLDHLDYHMDFNEYLDAKMKIFSNMDSECLGVYNLDDPIVSKSVLSKSWPFKLKSFSVDEEADSFVKRGSIFIKKDNTFLYVMDLEKLSVTGLFNLPNILATLPVFDYFGLSPECMEDSVMTFTWLPHRLEFVGIVKGVEVYNDSKATNPHAVIHALSFLKRYGKPIVLILGGSDKKLSFTSIVPYLKHLKAIFAYGDAGRSIEKQIKSFGYDDIFYEWDFRESVKRAFLFSKPGDILLLSPGCASFDQFSGYAERGKAFISIISELGGSD